MAQSIQVKETENLLKFETLNGVKTTKSFKTPKGDSIHFVYINEYTSIIASKTGDFSIQVIGSLNGKTTIKDVGSFFGGIWDHLKSGVMNIIRGMLQGEG